MPAAISAGRMPSHGPCQPLTTTPGAEMAKLGLKWTTRPSILAAAGVNKWGPTRQNQGSRRLRLVARAGTTACPRLASAGAAASAAAAHLLRASRSTASQLSAARASMWRFGAFTAASCMSMPGGPVRVPRSADRQGATRAAAMASAKGRCSRLGNASSVGHRACSMTSSASAHARQRMGKRGSAQCATSLGWWYRERHPRAFVLGGANQAALGSWTALPM